ncbi:MAG: ParA family protein [Elainella sp. C42_A2020_010]|nr:ParA family protein [Elainella sp. C42_A2020_010]RNJ68688.1 MAG: ParA family protein [Leptolyngbya sp. IPPAS B-1204]
MSHIFSVFNQAGGVAKTTLAMNLGYELAQLEQRVLLVDFDPQGTLTIFMGIEGWDLPATIYDCLIANRPATDVIHSAHGIDILPANLALGKAELELYHAPMREQKLHRVLEPLSEAYDLVIIDCPPSLGVISYLALVTADYVIVPLECEYKSYQGTDLLLQTIGKIQQEANPELKIATFVPVKVSLQKSQHQRVLAAIDSQLAQIAPIASPIPDAIAFADASERCLPLSLYDRRHRAVEPLRNLAKQILSIATTGQVEVLHA